MRLRFSAVLVFIATVLCQACAHAPRIASTRPAPITEFPIVIRNGLPTADVRVADRSFKLFLDLGDFSAISLTDTELKGTAVEFLNASVHYQDANASQFEARTFVARRVEIGGAQIGPLEGVEKILASYGPPDRNGDVGMGFLGRFLIVLDYPHHRVRLYQSGDRAAFELECGHVTFPVDTVNGVAQTSVATDLGELLFEWDTGSTDNVIRTSVLSRAGKTAEQSEDGPPTYRMHTMRLTGRELAPAEFRVIPFQAPAVDAVFGTPFYSGHVVCLDSKQKIGAVRL